MASWAPGRSQLSSAQDGDTGIITNQSLLAPNVSHSAIQITVLKPHCRIPHSEETVKQMVFFPETCGFCATHVEFLPNALDLQLRLGSRVLSFHCLIGNNSTNGASCSHVVKHDILKREAGTVKQKHLDIPHKQGKNPLLSELDTGQDYLLP